MPMTDNKAAQDSSMHAVSGAALKAFTSTPYVDPKNDPHYTQFKSKGKTLTNAARKAAIAAFKDGQCGVTAVREMRAKGVQVFAPPVLCRQ